MFVYGMCVVCIFVFVYVHVCICVCMYMCRCVLRNVQIVSKPFPL